MIFLTNSFLLNYKIKTSGFKVEFIAKEMNLSRTGLYNKINGKNEFYASEIQRLSKLLNLDIEERENIFFAS